MQQRPLEEHKIIVQRKCHYIIRIYLGHFQNNDKAILFPFQQINSEKIIASVIQFRLSSSLNNAYIINGQQKHYNIILMLRIVYMVLCGVCTVDVFKDRNQCFVRSVH